jgi:ribosomal-protein-alanine N-acetyltransferase
MHLRPFAGDEADPGGTLARAETVAAWCTSPDEAGMWCGYRGGLVPAEKIIGWAAEDGVRQFGLDDGGQLVAYGELWLDDDEREVELARLIVDPTRRGRGLGRTLVAELATLARRHYPDVFMRVHPANAAALHCYAGAGFVRVPAELETQWNERQPVAYVWLRDAAG